MLIVSHQGKGRITRIDTQMPSRPRTNSSDDAPNSVIHAPSGFKAFEGVQSEGMGTETEGSSNTAVSPATPEAALSPEDKVRRGSSCLWRCLGC